MEGSLTSVSWATELNTFGFLIPYFPQVTMGWRLLTSGGSRSIVEWEEIGSILSLEGAEND